MARQRQAIVDGLRDSINDFSATVPGTTAADVMNMMMTVQYLGPLFVMILLVIAMLAVVRETMW